MAGRNEFCTAYPVLARQSENTIGGLSAQARKNVLASLISTYAQQLFQIEHLRYRQNNRTA
jgi:hypothetical protein